METGRLIMIGADMKLSLQDAFIALLIVVSVCPMISADDGYELWMSYRKLDDSAILKEYRQAFSRLSLLE